MKRSTPQSPLLWPLQSVRRLLPQRNRRAPLSRLLWQMPSRQSSRSAMPQPNSARTLVYLQRWRLQRNDVKPQRQNARVMRWLPRCRGPRRSGGPRPKRHRLMRVMLRWQRQSSSGRQRLTSGRLLRLLRIFQVLRRLPGTLLLSWPGSGTRCGLIHKAISGVHSGPLKIFCLLLTQGVGMQKLLLFCKLIAVQFCFQIVELLQANASDRGSGMRAVL
jgi:hypothetical protein